MRARRMSRPICVAVLVALLVLPIASQAQPERGSPAEGGPAAPHPAAMAFDVVLLRPLGLLATVVGAGLFPFAALATAPGGRAAVEEAWEQFVVVPARSVFRRPLGEF